MKKLNYKSLLRQPSHLSGVQDVAEQRTEAYMVYGEGAAEAATPQCGKSNNSAAGSAGRQVDALRRV